MEGRVAVDLSLPGSGQRLRQPQAGRMRCGADIVHSVRSGASMLSVPPTGPRVRERSRLVGSPERSPILWLAALVVVGLALRAPWLHNSLYGDEVGAFYDVSGRSLGGMLHVLSGHSPELNPPLYFLVAWVCEKLFGISALSLRAISLVAGTSVIPLSHWLGRWTAGVRAGFVAAAIATVSPFIVFYSSEARPYALLLALSLLSTLALVRAIDTRRTGWWVAYAAASCASMYTHFTAVFALLLQFVWAFIAVPSCRRALVAANLSAALLFVPWIPNLIRTARSPGTKLYGLLEPFSLHAARIDLGQLWLGQPEQTVGAIPGLIPVALIVATLVLAALLAISTRAREHAWPKPSPRHALLLVLAFGVPVATGL